MDGDLHDALCDLVRRQGATELDRLVRQARRVRRDARVGPESVTDAVNGSTLLVGTPDGRVDHLVHVLDGCWFTQRVESPLATRRDLWVTVASAPLMSMLTVHPMPFADGGEIRAGAYETDAVIGPDGWLPEVPARGLVALGFQDGAVTTKVVRDEELPDLPEQQRVRALVARHYRRERWWNHEEDLESRPAELVRAVGLVALEDPTAFRQPLPPLDELLYDPLQLREDQHHWRDFAACRTGGTVSYSIGSMPEALHHELEARARVYGMSSDQFLIAIVGHLMWRTPFAEDMSYEQPEWASQPRPVATLHALPVDAGRP